MAASNRSIIHLECQTCRTAGIPGVSRYTTTKNKKTTPEKMLIKKFDPKARKHVDYKEIKLK